jgi:hypothetical protein
MVTGSPGCGFSGITAWRNGGVWALSEKVKSRKKKNRK